MGARRRRGNWDLPPNLYRVQSGSKTYWRYIHPRTKKRTNFCCPKAKAIAEAQKANAALIPATSLAEKMIGGSEETVFDVIHQFRRTHLKNQSMSKSHRYDWQWRLEKFQDTFSACPVKGVTTRMIAEWLDRFPGRSSNVYRARILQVFDWAVSRGYVDVNPVTPTLRRDESKQREPLTWEAFKAIYRCASPPIRHAMALSLLLLQRRKDITELRFDAIQDGYILIHQSKTGKRLMLRITPEIARLIERCRRYGGTSKYLVHKPARSKRQDGPPLSPESITRGFAKARDDSGVFVGIPSSKRPPFHEILGLGEARRREQGWTIGEIQAWRGHSSERMTAHYMRDHEYWERVEPGSGGKEFS